MSATIDRATELIQHRKSIRAMYPDDYDARIAPWLEVLPKVMAHHNVDPSMAAMIYFVEAQAINNRALNLIDVWTMSAAALEMIERASSDAAQAAPEED